MSSATFKAMVLTEEGGKTRHTIKDLSPDDLPEGDVLVAVEYSSLNFKDGLAVTGKGKIVRSFPMVPGIDLAGTVLESESVDYQPGDQVILTGWGVGERHWGGYAQRARLQSKWLVPMPEGLDTRRSMAIGTAGLTGMLCVLALEDAGVTPDQDLPVLVTGASGGVGGVAVAVLAKLGYQVTAVAGSPEDEDYVRGLGASAFVGRDEINQPARALENQRWAGAVDTIGTNVLGRVLAETNYGGCVAACGLAGGVDLPTTVMPFILRGVRLQGVDSVMCPVSRRKIAWERVVRDLPLEALGEIGHAATLEDVPRLAEEILAGQVRGRVVIDVSA